MKKELDKLLHEIRSLEEGTISAINSYQEDDLGGWEMALLDSRLGAVVDALDAAMNVFRKK